MHFKPLYLVNSFSVERERERERERLYYIKLTLVRKLSIVW